MKNTYINQFKEGAGIEGTFICIHKALLTDKNGKSYLNVKLMDRTGSVEGRIWDKAPLLANKFEKSDYVSVKGNVVSFQDHLQLNIKFIDPLPEEKVDLDDFLPTTKQDIPKMYESLLQICREDLKNPWVQKLILSILEDPEMAPAFKRSPAAKSNHHAWIGGLLEHVLNLCQLAKDVLKHYPQINLDLVLAGMIMHDFGKIYELKSDRYFEYTDRGQLVGHLIISLEILIKKAAKIPDFPEKVLQHLEHIILSHHGLLEYGSPKEPMTLEALVVHFLDNMDSKIQGFLDVIAKEPGGDSTWTGQNFVFRRPLYKRTATDMNESTGKPAGTGPVPAPKTAPAQKDKTVAKKPNPTKQPSPKKQHSKAPLKTSLGDLLSEQIKENQSQKKA